MSTGWRALILHGWPSQCCTTSPKRGSSRSAEWKNSSSSAGSSADHQASRFDDLPGMVDTEMVRKIGIAGHVEYYQVRLFTRLNGTDAMTTIQSRGGI